jgi:lipoprotein-anchoring transpeptidase ErfK/SrfK
MTQTRCNSLCLLALLAGVLLLSGCRPSSRDYLPTPTRTPRPTYTPTVLATATFTPAPTATPQPSATFTPRPAPTQVALPPTPSPTSRPLSSPFAGRVPQAGRAILLDQDMQRLYVFENGVEIRSIRVSTGDPDGAGTREWEGVVGAYVGKIYSFGTYADYAWYLFEDRGAILIHSVPYTLKPDGSKEYEALDALGVMPVSHGCIRMADEDARWFTFWEPAGVPIIITPWTGGERAAG